MKNLDKDESKLDCESEDTKNYKLEPMFYLDVVVRGPGMVINNEMDYLEKILRDAGYQVKIENDNPCCDIKLREHLAENYGEENVEKKLIDARKKMRKNYLRRIRKTSITLKADHRPWGG